MIMGVSVYVSTLTSMAIAVDRYFAIVHPLRSRLTSRGCLIVIGAVWAASVTVTLPLAIHQNHAVDEQNGTIVRSCNEDWQHPDARRLFTVGRSVSRSFERTVLLEIAIKHILRSKKKHVTTSSTIS